jgi:hypothetical protein
MEDLDALKSNPAVLRVYGHHIKLHKQGSVYMGSCPFHADGTPSFAIHADGLWTCHGGCGSGNVFQFLERVEGISFKEAVARVKAEVGDTSWEDSRRKVDSTFKPVAEQKTYKTITLDAWKKLEDNLAGSKAAQEFLLNERGIALSTAQRLRVGFVQNLGSLAGADGADIADKGWLAFPSIEDDKVISVKYRSIFRKKPGGFSRQPGMATALWNTETISPFDPAMVCEGEFDAMALEQAGFRAVSVPSAGAKLTPEMKDKLMQASLVILAGDTDAAGTASVDKLWKELPERCFKLTWPGGMKDANQCFLETCGRDVARFSALVEELTRKAKSQPMHSVYSLQETMLNGEQVSLSEHPDRLRFPWGAVDTMANVMPGDILGIGSTNTGMAKTTLVVQITMYNARKYGRCILNFQTEMRPDEIATMATAQILRKDRNFLTAEDKKLAAAELEGVQYYVGCDPQLTDINAVLDLLEAAIKRLSPYCVVLDHFHHLTTGMDNETRVQAAAMTRIKQIAQTYGVVFINVGQPRKATQQAKGKQIHITDFKGSGAWGDAANAVMAIHRDLNKSDDPTMSKGVYEDKSLIKLLKGRSMGTGASASYLTFFGEMASFEDLDIVHEFSPE